MGEKQTGYKNKYNSKNYDRINLVVAKGKRDVYSAHAKLKDKSLNRLIVDLLDEDMGKNK